MIATMKSLVPTIKSWFALPSKRGFTLSCLMICGLMGSLLAIDIGHSREQMRSLLEQSAKEMAVRISKGLRATVWEVFDPSVSPEYSEGVAAGVIDAELAAQFALSVHVYANFGSLLVAREKLPSGEVQPVVMSNEMVTIPLRRGKVRQPIHSGVMTIGHIEVYYTDKFQQGQRLARTYQVSAIYTGFTLLLLALLYLLRRSSIAHLQAQNSLERLKQAQEQLIQSEKMASLGSLVAGLAHEVNTPLGIALTSSTASLMMTQEIQDELKRNTLSRSALESYLASMVESSSMAERGLMRAADLVGHFKLISVDQNIEEPREIDLVSYVQEVLSTLSIELRKAGCRYSVEGDKRLMVKTVPGSIAQIITNLTNNALMHAFEGVEHKTIRIELKQLDGEVAQIRFKDNGVGMPASTLNHIYEPFFTTKRGEGGSGLGMNITFNLVTTRLQGQIEISSELEQGTCVEIRFPLVAEAD